MIMTAAAAIMYMSADGPTSGLGAGEGEAELVGETVGEGEAVAAGVLVGSVVWVGVGVEVGAVVTEGDAAAPTPTRVSADEAQ